MLKASLPGQLNPFDIYTNIDSYYNPPLEARVIDWKESSSQIYRNATIVSVSFGQDNMIGTSVTADVRNDEAKPLLNVKGVIWGLGQLNAIGSKDIADKLDPGETVTFSSTLMNEFNLNHIHVSAQGILQP